MPDTGASSISTVGKPQFEALQRINLSIKLDTTADIKSVKFGKGLAESLGTTELYTLFGPITFYIINSETPFLIYLHDIDRLNIEFRNITDEVVRTIDSLSVPTVRK
jgi:hypothetical protein